MAAESTSAVAEKQLRRVRAHIEELRRDGRMADAEALQFIGDLAERALTEVTPASTRRLLTTGQAALALGVSDQTVRNWVAAGRLPAVRRGARTMIEPEAVRQEIERSRIPPRASTPGPTEIAWRKALLDALPCELTARLEALHDKMEDGEQLSAGEQREMVQLEREMADAAARHLATLVRGMPSRDS